MYVTQLFMPPDEGGRMEESMENGFSIGGIYPKQDISSGGKVVADTGYTRSHRKQKEEERQSIYLGDITQGDTQDQVSEKYALAQRRAIKTILDQLEDDVNTDDGMAEEAAHIQQLQESIRGYYDGIDNVQSRRERIQNTYQVDPDSQEQKDLELMQKAEQHQRDPFHEEYMLTEEEQEHLNTLHERTMYQQDMLLCDKEEQQYRDNINTARRDIEIGKATIYATQKALLKVHPMTEAMDAAEDIMDAANQERIGALFEEGVDALEEKNAETQTEIAENQEKALEEKVKREKIKAEEAEREEAEEELMGSVLSATLQAMTFGQQTSDSMQTNVKNLIQDQVLLDVDIKGLRVDKQI